MAAHINLTGIWEDCTQNNCDLPFHLNELSAAEVAQVHPALMHELFNLEELTPPATIVEKHHREWLDADLQRHRDYDLPATVYNAGDKYWYRHGMLHRDHDRPAIEYAHGNREWWLNGETARAADKPAVIDADGTQTWYHNGRVGRANGLHTMLTQYGDRQWHDPNGLLHRENGLPAVIRADGSGEYWSHGEMIKWASRV